MPNTLTNLCFYPIVILKTPNYDKRFHSKHKQCRPDQTASPEANCSESAVYWNIVRHSKVGYATIYLNFKVSHL